MKVIDNQLKSIFRKIGIIITKEDYNEDLELDSIQLVMLLVSIQKSFLINVFERDDIDYTSLITFADFKKMIERLLEL